jgi:SAM-dependent methyltransferase
MFEKRSYELEHLDKGDYTEEEYESCLAELRWINRYLGDANALRKTLLHDISKLKLNTFSVLDVGAGSGELLRVIARYAQTTNRSSKLVGLELNEHAAASILYESLSYNEISVVRGDALTLPFNDSSFDYVICSLFTHHFNEELVVKIFKELSRVSRHKIFVIDLHRHIAAYYLFKTLCQLFSHNRLIKDDGSLSILKSFRPAELYQLAEQAYLKNINVSRYFPFRLVLSANK